MFLCHVVVTILSIIFRGRIRAHQTYKIFLSPFLTFWSFLIYILQWFFISSFSKSSKFFKGQPLVVWQLKKKFFMCVFTKLFIIFRLEFPSVEYTGYKQKIKKPTLNLNWIHLKIVIFFSSMVPSVSSQRSSTAVQSVSGQRSSRVVPSISAQRSSNTVPSVSGQRSSTAMPSVTG